MGTAESSPAAAEKEAGGEFDLFDWVLSCGGSREEKSVSPLDPLRATSLANAAHSVHAIRLPSPRRPLTPVAKKPRLSARKRLREVTGDYIELLSYLYVGEDSFATDYRLLRDLGITHVCNAATHVVACPFPKKIKYLKMALEDRGAEQVSHWFLPFMAFVDDAKRNGGKCLVHHTDTINVSAAIALAYYMFDTRATMDVASKFVKDKRGDVGLNSGFLCQLLEHAKRINSKPEKARCYVIARHSSRDKALVPQACLLPPHRVPMDLGPSTLDSRLTYVIHARDATFVWVGRNCVDAAGKVKVAEQTARQICAFENGPRVLHILVQPGGPKPGSVHKHAVADTSAPEYVKFGDLVGESSASFWADIGRSSALDIFAALDNAGGEEAAQKRSNNASPPSIQETSQGSTTTSIRTTALKGLKLDAKSLSVHADSAPLSSRREDRADSGARELSATEKGQLMRLTGGGVVEDLGVYDMEDLTPKDAFIFIAPSRRDRPFVWVGSKFMNGAPNAAQSAKKQAATVCSIDEDALHVESEGKESDEFWELFDMY